LGIGLWVIGIIVHYILLRGPRSPFAETVHFLDEYRIAWEEWFVWFTLHSSDNLIPLNAAGQITVRS
jgi:hypothetical protein